MRNKVLISLDDTSLIESVARRLIRCGFEVVATKESEVKLNDIGLDCQSIEKFIGEEFDYQFPPTMHPSIEYALTDNGGVIDIVFVIPYSHDKGNDIGGNTLLMLAAKGKRIPVSSYQDMDRVLNELEVNGRVSGLLRDSLISNTYLSYLDHINMLLGDEYEVNAFKRMRKLLHGENPYQTNSYLYSKYAGDDEYSLENYNQVSGVDLCYTNAADLDNLIDVLEALAKSCLLNLGAIPYVCVTAKHGNPCGTSISFDSKELVINNALWGDPLAVWGGELICNFKIDESLSRVLYSDNDRAYKYGSAKWSLDLVVSPEFDREAIDVLGGADKRKLLSNVDLYDIGNKEIDLDLNSYRFVRGGCISQSCASYILNLDDLHYSNIGLAEVDPKVVGSILIAWAVAYKSNRGGNEVAIAKDCMLVGLGGGPSTVEAAEVAVNKSEKYHKIDDSTVFCADAFIPFVDAAEVLSSCGYGVAPAGGVNYCLVKDYFAQNLKGFFFIKEEFRGFARH